MKLKTTIIELIIFTILFWKYINYAR